MLRILNAKEINLMANKPEKKSSYEIHPIGFVQSDEQKGQFEIKLLPPFNEGLEKLATFSHVIILWWADRHDNPEERSILITPLPYAKGTKAGVFACRSEYRPNPIGITTMPILNIDEANGIITLPWIDAFDGTPVLDLKPYIPSSDRVRDFRVADWMKEWAGMDGRSGALRRK
jgi:tRNA-Thr(GGU) m(6)t(6)A37 methyltransferase TsaA